VDKLNYNDSSTDSDTEKNINFMDSKSMIMVELLSKNDETVQSDDSEYNPFSEKYSSEKESKSEDCDTN